MPPDEALALVAVQGFPSVWSWPTFASMAGRTIQDAIDSGERIEAWCHAYLCNHHSTLDMLALRDKLGPDHGAMHDDLVPKLVCAKCGGKKVGIIVTPGAKQYGGNPYARAREGR